MKVSKLLYGLSTIVLMNALVGCTKEEMKLKQNSYTIEYGSTIQTDIKTYLDNTDDYIKETKLSGIPENEEEKEYPAIGEYELTLKNDDQESKVKVTITDTIAPAFKDIKETYEVDYGKNFDVKNIKAEDLSEVECTLDDSSVNYKKSATYDATVIAKDSSGNQAKQNIKIKVKEEEKRETTKSTNKSNSNTSKKSGTKSSSKGTSSSKNNSSSSSNSSKSSGSTSSASSSGSSSNNSSSSSGGSEITVTKDPNDHTEFDGGYADGYEEFEWPSDWE